MSPALAGEPTTQSLARYLAAQALFAELSEAERERVAQGCELHRHERGDMLFRVGDPCSAFYFVVSGQIRLYVASPSGQEKVIEIIGPGHSFAEALIFLEQPYIVNAQALSDSLLVRVGRACVLDEVQRDPRFALRLLAGISRRLHRLVRDVEGYSLHSASQRLIGFLLHEIPHELAEGNAASVVLQLPASKATVASRLSLTPEYFSRVLHELQDQGLIQIERREIRIPDVRRLARFEAP